MSVELLGSGVYSFAEAARLVSFAEATRLVRVRPARVRAWFTGSGREPVMHSDYEEVPSRQRLISFLDLIDTLVIARLRTKGVSLQYLRRVHGALVEEFRSPHPFCQKKLLTDGKRVFIHIADELGEEHLRELLTGQHAFPRILGPTLARVEYDSTSLLASQWNIAAGVVVDPRRQYGKPIVESTGLPTAILAAAHRANDRNTRVVADWYGITPKEVNLAVRFERRMDKAVA